MIVQPFVSPTGGHCGFHKVQHIQQLYPYIHTNVEVNSYASEEAFLSGSGPMWVSRITVEPLETVGTLVDSVERWLISNAESPFFGGAVSVDNSQTLEAARARAWIRVKAARAIAEVGTFNYDGGIYDVDSTRITGAVTLAMLAKMHDTPFTMAWTLADNTVRELDGDQFIALGVALGQYVDGIYGTARALRVAIEAAPTIEAVDAVVWPT